MRGSYSGRRFASGDVLLGSLVRQKLKSMELPKSQTWLFPTMMTDKPWIENKFGAQKTCPKLSVKMMFTNL